MTPDLELDRKLRASLHELADAPEVPAPSEFPRPTVAPTKRQNHRFLVPAIAFALIAVFVIGAGTLPSAISHWLSSAGDGGDKAPSLPDDFAGESMWTADLGRSGMDRTIAAYELFPIRKGYAYNGRKPVILLSADGDRYRRAGKIERLSGATSSDWVLSPDGRHVWVSGSDKATILDIGTNTAREYPLPEHTIPVFLTWSDDGRTVAFAVSQNSRSGIHLLDVATGGLTVVPRTPSIVNAAFSPSGQTIATQYGDTIGIIDRTGQLQRTFEMPIPGSLVRFGAWSPDGSLLAFRVRIGDRQRFMIISATGSPIVDQAASAGYYLVGDMPVGGRLEFMGWRSPQRIVYGTDGAINEASLDGVHNVVIARVRDTTKLQLASALLPGMVVRSAGKTNRGPLPYWVQGLAIFVIVAPVAGVLLVRRSRRRQTVHKG